MKTPPRVARIGRVAVVVAAVTLSGCSSGSAAPKATTASSTTTSTSAALPTTSAALPTVDHCVIGTWRALGGKLPQQVGSDTVTLSGGSGTVLRFAASGAYGADFSKSRPYKGRSGRRLVSLAVSGTASGTFTAQTGLLSLFDNHTTLVVTLRVDAKVSSRQHPSNSSSAVYTCKGSVLTLTSGTDATNYARLG